MSENTKIEWADHTFNPWEGCQKVGPGCDNCYAENRNARFGGGVAVNWGPGAPRRHTSAANWRKPIAWDAAGWAFQAEHGRRQRVFCASLADVFDNAVPNEWRVDLFNLILATPNLDWLLLTKRIGNVMGMLPPTVNRFEDIYPNVWIGATVVNQEEADRDIVKLLQVPARVRFLSIEPMLGPIDLRNIPVGGGHGHHEFDPIITGNALKRSTTDAPRVHWVIAGGESGPGARPAHPDWFRSLRDQCAAAGTPYLFKQWGEWTPGENVERRHGTVDTAFWGDGWSIYPLNLATDDGHIDDQPDLYRVGRKEAGRRLDGVTHDGFPA